jgi:membrane protein implicated in regulation of membrane protease activity
MRLIKGFLGFWYDFIVGDDWLVAAGVVVLLVAAGVLAQANLHTTAWLVMPVGVVLVLAISLRRAVGTVDHRPHQESVQ